jgi:nucleoside-diphosphate-sugar epimerase
MSIVITGVSGYLGKALISNYNDSNEEIILTYRNNKLNTLNNNFIWKKINLNSNHSKVYDYLLKPDTLIHLAWDGLSLRDYNSKIHIEQVDNHLNFIESLIKNGLKNIIVTGTCMEYGDYEGELEENMIANPETKYGQAKNILREKLFLLKKKYKFNLTWLRLFYFYGGEKNTKDLWGNINLAIQNKDISFQMSKGTQLRDYLNIKDVAKYIYKISSLKKDLGIINICSNIPISIKELVKKWINENNWKIKVEINAVPISDHEKKNFWGSNKKLKFYTK